ncbi:MAG TPA: winged helix-turn-helix domain-containing protein [Candidatus Angelobacter sp.]|jgi:DNA-binding winged helix-turn-helix (wHTH) protein/Tol biopolymer transport system component
MTLTHKHIYEFGDCRIDPTEQTLARNGVLVPLTPKVFETLLILLEKPGRLVGKDEFIVRLWPGTFVDEVAVSQNISRLRKALGDGDGGTTIIQTVPKRGYRIVADVRVVTQPSSELSPPAISVDRGQATVTNADNKPRKPSALRRLMFVVASLLVLILAAWIWQPPDPKLLRTVQITFGGKADTRLGLQVDGSKIIFGERRGPNWELLQTSLGGGAETPFAPPFPDTRIFGLSPDQTTFLIATAADSSGGMPLWIRPVQGGPPLRVGVSVDAANWFPDGRRILCSRDGEVFSIERDGRNRRHLFNVDGTAVDLHWHPNGSRFRFTLVDRKDELSLWEANAEGDNPHLLDTGLSGRHFDCCGAWMPDGKNYVFSSLTDRGQDMWVLHEPQGLARLFPNKPLQLTTGPNAFRSPVPSKEGNKIFVLGSDWQSSSYWYDQQKDEFFPLWGPIAREVYGDVTYSHDGQWVAYIGPGLILWRSRADGSERQQLTSSPMWVLRPRWSKDGKRILFVGQTPDNIYSAYIVPVEGGGPTRVLEGDKDYRSFADWSPDEKSVIMDVLPGWNPSAGITAVNLDTRKVSELPGSAGMRNMHWSPDGRLLAATSEDGKSLYFFDNSLQRWTKVATGQVVSRCEWSADSRYFYFQDVRDSRQAAFRLAVETGKVERILDFTKQLQGGVLRAWWIGITPDGHHLANFQSGETNVYALEVKLP